MMFAVTHQMSLKPRSAKCGMNLLWLNLQAASQNSHTPILPNRIWAIANTYFKTPKPLMSDVVVAVPKTWASGAAKIDRTDVETAKPFKLVSPPEKVHALIFALLRDVRESESSLDEWRRIALSCSCEIVAMESPQELYLKNLELREAPGIEYELVRHSALQRILDVSFAASKLPQWKNSSSSALGKLLHQEYYKDIVVSGMSEPLTENGITTCIEVYSKLFVKHPSVVSLLRKMDDMYGVGNPLDSTVKLNDLLTKVKNEVQGHMTSKISGDIGIWVHVMTVPTIILFQYFGLLS